MDETMGEGLGAENATNFPDELFVSFDGSYVRVEQEAARLARIGAVTSVGRYVLADRYDLTVETHLTEKGGLSKQDVV